MLAAWTTKPLPAIFDRYPDLALAVEPGELRPLESFVSSGYRALPAWLYGGALPFT